MNLSTKIHEKVLEIKRINNAYISYTIQQFNTGRSAGQRDRQMVTTKVTNIAFDYKRLTWACLALSSIVPVGIVMASTRFYNEAILTEIILLSIACISYGKSKTKLGEE